MGAFLILKLLLQRGKPAWLCSTKYSELTINAPAHGSGLVGSGAGGGEH